MFWGVHMQLKPFFPAVWFSCRVECPRHNLVGGQGGLIGALLGQVVVVKCNWLRSLG